MKISYFFRPKMEGVHSIETLFYDLLKNLPRFVEPNIYVCTHKWKRFHSFYRSRKFQGEINHITGDIHTIALFLKKRKTILTVHDIGRYERDLTGLRKYLFKVLWLDLPLRSVNYITTISDFTKRRLMEVCKIPEEKIHVIPNPACTDFHFRPKKYNGSNPCILQIGSGNNKNVHRLIEAVKATKFKLLLIRKPDQSLEKLLIDAKINYEWKYNISRIEIFNCYYACDIVFFASEYEGFGVPILEANSVGRPVITSNISSMPYVAGDSALLVNPYKVESIKNAIKTLDEDEALRNKLIQNGLHNLKRFSMEAVTNQYMQLYNKIISRK